MRLSKRNGAKNTTILSVVLGALLQNLFLCCCGHVVVPKNEVPKFGYDSCRCASSLPPGLSVERLTDKLGLSTEQARNFGIGCAPHNLNTTECNGGEQEISSTNEECHDGVYPVPAQCKIPEKPSWCDKKWCFVDNVTECSLVFSETDDFPGIPYSFAACGERNFFSSNPLDNVLKNEILSVAYRTNSGGWLGSYHPNGFNNQVPMARDDKWYGMVPKFVDEFAKSSGAIINMTEAPLLVYDVSNSTDFNNCVHAVSLGMLDFCAAMYTVTNERAIMTNFFTFETTPVYLVVRQEEGESLGERMLGPCKPFTLGAWVYVMAILLSSSFVLFCLETLPGGMYHSDDDDVKEKTLLARMATSAYLGLHGFTSGDVGNDFITWQGRGTALGIGFFILIIQAMYNANLTNLLVAQASKSPLSGIEDAIHRNIRICVGVSTWRLINNLYPSAAWETIDGRRTLIDAIANGECKAGLLYVEDLEVLQSKGEYCELGLVGRPVVYAYRGIPLNPLKTKELAYHFQKVINEGVWDELKQKGLYNQCHYDTEDGDSLQFDAFDIFGISMICVGVTALFGFLSAIRWRRIRGQQNNDET